MEHERERERDRLYCFPPIICERCTGVKTLKIPLEKISSYMTTKTFDASHKCIITNQQK